MRKLIKVVLMFIVGILVVVLGYVGYVMITYYRIGDNTLIETVNNQSTLVELNKEYSIQTYNIGFGAYDHEFSFFMDSGEMLDGTKVQGTRGKAANLEVVLKNTAGAIEVSKATNSDFYIFQEVDVKADRSYKVNQLNELTKSFDEYGAAFAYNFHSAFLAYPIPDFHGASDAGLLTLSKYQVSQNIRKQYIIDMSFPYKYMDLDRCFLITRIPTANNKELVIINSHMSAYDAGGKIRQQQLAQLNAVLAEEYAKGNYVILGGDFNHDIANSKGIFETQQKEPAWVADLSNADIAEHYSIVVASNYQDVPTCRSTDLAYIKGVNYTVVIDGFIISDNISATAINVDNNFAYSDHNPVVMSFTLND